MKNVEESMKILENKKNNSNVALSSELFDIFTKMFLLISDMIIKENAGQTGHMHPAAAESEDAKNAAAVQMGVLFGIGLDEPVHGEIAQRLQWNADQAEKGGPENRTVRQMQVHGKKAFHA